MAVPTDQEVLGYLDDLSNWGRWGADDELGTLNLISAEKRARAAGLAVLGETISCAWDLDLGAVADRDEGPRQRFFRATGEGLHDEHRLRPEWMGAEDRQSSASEYIGLVFHGLGVTHLDSLAHFFWDGRMYNGYPAEWVNSRRGATRLDVTGGRGGIVTRGVLADAARFRGVPWLEPGEGVTNEELTAILDSQHVTLEPGDALLLRTGKGAAKRADALTFGLDAGQPGYQASCLPLFREHDLALVGSDTAQDVSPSGYETVRFPIHTVGIVAMGLWLLDNCDLEALARSCAEHDRWEFCFAAVPLPLVGCTGSPVNPIAML